MQPRAVFSHWEQVRRDLITTIGSFEDGELTYVPFEGAWSAGAIMLHIADAEDGWLRYVVTKELDGWPRQYLLGNYPTREAVIAALAEVHTRTEAFLAALSEEDLSRTVSAPWGSEFRLGWIIWHLLEHEIHHRGELSLILGLLGREGLDV